MTRWTEITVHVLDGLVQEPIPHLGIAPGLDRLVGIVVGVGLVGLVALATWPLRARIQAHFRPLEERNA